MNTAKPFDPTTTEDAHLLQFLANVLAHLPSDWLKLTTHRLDIYTEKLAKTEFLEHLDHLYQQQQVNTEALRDLPTAYDYIRLGHPLSCVLEWSIARSHGVSADQVISFASQTAPILAVLRKNHFEKKNTQICYSGELPTFFDADTVKRVYGYAFELKQVGGPDEITDFNGSTIFLSEETEISPFNTLPPVDFYICTLGHLGSIILVNGEHNRSYISEIQHVRRRETIAMTPADCFSVLKTMTQSTALDTSRGPQKDDLKVVQEALHNITGVTTKVLVGSSGLSVQYAIMMGLVHHAMEHHPGKAIKFIVPPNCYGGTNDQARRVAACLDHVEVVDLPVDAGSDMVQSIETVLTRMAAEDAVPYIIVEIPTNPRVEVPNLPDLQAALVQVRHTPAGEKAIDPVFILDQTFCPNVHFLGADKILGAVRTVVYASGSKFPSGGLCTAGYCVGNTLVVDVMDTIERHLNLCDNAATGLQVGLLAQQLPSMNQRIAKAYQNTRAFVNHIQVTLPGAKINFVSEKLAKEGFTPSVFSLDLPTKGETEEARETYKRALNHQLIQLMISQIPKESKYCVSYGQLKGCYWTIPATSTQGTTKEGDKDYIARVALSPNMDLERHMEVFSAFVEGL